MSIELNEENLCAVIADAIKDATNTDELSEAITMDSAINAPPEWDSLSFVAVFNAVGAAFDQEFDDDDAVHFQASRSIYEFLVEITGR